MSRIYSICLLLLLLLFTTCEEGADHTITLEFPPPRLAFSPDTIYFSVPGDSLLPGQRVQKEMRLWNQGGGTVRWTLFESSDWLALSCTTGTCEDGVRRVAVTALFDRINDETVEGGAITLAAGDETATVPVVASKYSGQQICASDSSFEFDGSTDPAPKYLLVRTCGSWESHWTAYSNKSWLLITPDKGSSSGEWQRLTITVDWSQFLYPVEESGWIILDGPNDIWISVRVSWPGPLLCLSSKNIYELWQFPATDPVTFRVGRCEPGRAIEWNVFAEDSWVLLFPHDGRSTGEWDTVTMSIDWPIDWLSVPDQMSRVFVATATETLSLALIAHPACQLAFIEPAAGTLWIAGDRETIRWRHASAGNYVYLSLYKGDRILTTIAEPGEDYGVINDGEHSWKVSARNLVAGSDYHLEIRSSDDWNTCWAKSEDFTIAVPECYVTVHRPSIYDRFDPGDIMTIYWSTHASATAVAIDLYLNNLLICTITPWTENDGRFIWPVPSLSTGENWYQVKVTDANHPACAGFSEMFWING